MSTPPPRIQLDLILPITKFDSQAKQYECFSEVVTLGIMPELKRSGTELPFALEKEFRDATGSCLNQELYLLDNGVVADLRYSRKRLEADGPLRVDWAAMEFISRTDSAEQARDSFETYIKRCYDAWNAL